MGQFTEEERNKIQYCFEQEIKKAISKIVNNQNKNHGILLDFDPYCKQIKIKTICDINVNTHNIHDLDKKMKEKASCILAEIKAIFDDNSISYIDSSFSALYDNPIIIDFYF